MSEHAPCPACGGHSRACRLFSEEGERRYFLRKCCACRAEFLHPMPDCKRLEAEYADYFIRRGVGPVETKWPYFRRLLGKIPNLSTCRTVLEIGAGEGHLTAYLRKNHPEIEITVVEPGPRADAVADTGVQWVFSTIEEWLRTAPPRRFDVIIGLDVLEHLVNPRDVLRSLSARHMAPGGTVLFTSPDASSPSHAMLGRLWPHYKFEHVWYPTGAALDALEGACALVRERCERNWKTLPLGYIVRIAANFGPRSVRRGAGIVASLLPSAITNRSLTLPSGELLWVARRVEGDPQSDLAGTPPRC